MITCPVCNYRIETDCDYMDYTLMEEHATCQCGYSYDYVTGCYQETFGPFEFIQYYSGEEFKNTILSFGVSVWLWRLVWLIRSM